MTLTAITQRSYIDPAYNEPRDCVDRRWHAFFHQIGVTPILMPNNINCVKDIVHTLPINSIVFTGGGTLGAYGGKTPERDETETFLFNHAIENSLPLLGVCHGMQVIQHHYGVALQEVNNHVCASQEITINENRETVNSYHDFAATTSIAELEVWAKADDGIIKAIQHSSLPITGIMWHPERLDPFSPRDIALFKRVLKGNQ